ncbi:MULTISPECIES: hypothetical protein [Streptomyces]|nr:hypothetical protein [Streptomyces sp. AK02-04a]MDX3758958.1 hypothetical protein [Streptomyces sp. AK02-04a]
MRNKMLRSVLVAAFSAVVAFGALGGLSGAKGDVRADSHWPAAAADIQTIQTVSTADDGSGS